MGSEHNTRVIMGISQRVVALHMGEVIAIGSPAAVTSDARVIEAYERLPAHRIVDLGLSHVLERRRLFPYLTLGQNVLLGAYPPGARARHSTPRGEVEGLFPLLQARGGQPARTLSGGEQQMISQVITRPNRERP